MPFLFDKLLAVLPTDEQALSTCALEPKTRVMVPLDPHWRFIQRPRIEELHSHRDVGEGTRMDQITERSFVRLTQRSRRAEEANSVALVGISVGERDHDADTWSLRVKCLLPTDASRGLYDKLVPVPTSDSLRCCRERCPETLKATEIADELVLNLPSSDARHQ